jgi:hypothetical protein
VKRAWAEGAPPTSQRHRVALIAILVVGAALRIAWIVYAARPALGLFDPAAYSGHAIELAHGDGYRFLGGDKTAYYPIGYPAALGAALWLAQHLPVPDDVWNVAAVLNLVLGVATIALGFEAGRRLANDVRVGLVAAGLLALWPNLVFHSAVALSETLFNALVLAFVLVLVFRPWTAAITRRAAVLAGALLGLSALVRPISLLVLPVLAVVWGRTAVIGWRRAFGALAVVTGITVLLLAPWVVRNTAVMHSPVLATNFGDNACIGHNPEASGAFGLPASCFAGYNGLDRPKYEVRRNRELSADAIQYALGHPLTELRLTVWRAYYTLEGDHDGLTAAESYGDDPFIPPRTHDLLALLADGWFFAVTGIALLGIPLVLRRRDPRWTLVLGTAVAMAVPPLLFFGDPRFHVPVVPFLALLAAVTTVTVRDAARPARQLRRGSTGASRPVPGVLPLARPDCSSWYSASTLTDQMSWSSPVQMFSTVSIAVYIEWSWLLYLCIPLRPTGCTFSALASSQRRNTSTLSR